MTKINVEKRKKLFPNPLVWTKSKPIILFKILGNFMSVSEATPLGFKTKYTTCKHHFEHRN